MGVGADIGLTVGRHRSQAAPGLGARAIDAVRQARTEGREQLPERRNPPRAQRAVPATELGGPGKSQRGAERGHHGVQLIVGEPESRHEARIQARNRQRVSLDRPHVHAHPVTCEQRRRPRPRSQHYDGREHRPVHGLHPDDAPGGHRERAHRRVARDSHAARHEPIAQRAAEKERIAGLVGRIVEGAARCARASPRAAARAAPRPRRPPARPRARAARASRNSRTACSKLARSR